MSAAGQGRAGPNHRASRRQLQANAARKQKGCTLTLPSWRKEMLSASAGLQAPEEPRHWSKPEPLYLAGFLFPTPQRCLPVS